MIALCPFGTSVGVGPRQLFSGAAGFRVVDGKAYALVRYDMLETARNPMHEIAQICMRHERIVDL